MATDATAERDPAPRAEMPRAAAMAWLALILLAGGALRLARLDSVPPGLWYDEGLDLQDARAALSGGLKLVYPDVFPREPMFITLLVGAMRAFGSDVARLRLVPAIIGILTLAAVYGCAARFAGRRVGLLSAGILAGMSWHATFSHLLFRTLLMPLWIALIVWATARLREKATFARAAALGALIGGGFYTYLSWWFFLPGVIALAAWALFAGESKARRARAALCLAVAAAVAAPILLKYAAQPELLVARPEEVSPFKGGDGAREIAKNLAQALGMFHWSGDHVPKHNIPRAPALDPLQGLLFVAGISLSLFRLRRRDPFAIILLGWLALGVAPTIFTKTDSPNFLRTLGATPAVAMIAALGLGGAWDWAARKFGGRRSNLLAAGCVLIAVAFSGAWTDRRIFLEWAVSPEVFDGFNGGETQLGQAAARTPPGATFWAPGRIGENRSFQYLAGLDGQKRPATSEGERVHLYVNFEFLGADGVSGGERRIVATAHNQLLPVLERLAPAGRVIDQFKSPAGNTWAVLYAIPAGARIPAEEIRRAQASHPVDIGW